MVTPPAELTRSRTDAPSSAAAPAYCMLLGCCRCLHAQRYHRTSDQRRCCDGHVSAMSTRADQRADCPLCPACAVCCCCYPACCGTCMLPNAQLCDSRPTLSLLATHVTLSPSGQLPIDLALTNNENSEPRLRLSGMRDRAARLRDAGVLSDLSPAASSGTAPVDTSDIMPSSVTTSPSPPAGFSVASVLNTSRAHQRSVDADDGTVPDLFHHYSKIFECQQAPAACSRLQPPAAGLRAADAAMLCCAAALLSL